MSSLDKFREQLDNLNNVITENNQLKEQLENTEKGKGLAPTESTSDRNDRIRQIVTERVNSFIPLIVKSIAEPLERLLQLNEQPIEFATSEKVIRDMRKYLFAKNDYMKKKDTDEYNKEDLVDWDFTQNKTPNDDTIFCMKFFDWYDSFVKISVEMPPYKEPLPFGEDNSLSEPLIKVFLPTEHDLMNYSRLDNDYPLFTYGDKRLNRFLDFAEEGAKELADKTQRLIASHCLSQIATYNGQIESLTNFIRDTYYDIQGRGGDDFLKDFDFDKVLSVSHIDTTIPVFLDKYSAMTTAERIDLLQNYKETFEEMSELSDKISSIEREFETSIKTQQIAEMSDVVNDEMKNIMLKIQDMVETHFVVYQKVSEMIGVDKKYFDTERCMDMLIENLKSRLQSIYGEKTSTVPEWDVRKYNDNTLYLSYRTNVAHYSNEPIFSNEFDNNAFALIKVQVGVGEGVTVYVKNEMNNAHYFNIADFFGKENNPMHSIKEFMTNMAVKVQSMTDTLEMKENAYLQSKINMFKTQNGLVNNQLKLKEIETETEKDKEDFER